MSWFTWRRRPSLDERLDAELRDHVERQVADSIAHGMNEADARREVRLELGGLDQAKEACRDVRPGRWLGEFVRDVRLGFRSLSRDRLFAASVTAILALGIGTSVTMFSVLNAVVLRPLPYARPAELARISTHLIAQDRWDGSAMANILDWREQSDAFASMTFYRRTSASVVTFAGIDAPQRAQEGLVGPGFLRSAGYADAHRTDLLARGIRARRAGRRVERGALAGTIRGVRRGARPDALDRRQGPRGDRRHAADLPAAHQRHAILEAVVRFAVVAGDHIDPR